MSETVIRTNEIDGQWEAYDPQIEQQWTVGFGKTEEEAIEDCITQKESLVDDLIKEILNGSIKMLKLNHTKSSTYKDAIESLQETLEDDEYIGNLIELARTPDE